MLCALVHLMLLLLLLAMKQIYLLLGDSTSCIYGYDDNYALPRAGWGMYLGDFLRSKYHVEDLAMSGRSSKSFATEDNYKKAFI
mgnify:CR=1 FL=1